MTFTKGFIEIGVLEVPSFFADQANYVTVGAAPIDGVTINVLLNDGDEFRTHTVVPYSYKMPDLSASLSYLNVRNELGWGERVKNNFIMAQVVSLDGLPIDWFSNDIEHVINNFSLMGKFATEAGLTGIFFDSEGYTPMWQYDQMPNKTDHTFQEYEDRVEQSGFAIAANWLRYNPDMQVIFTSAYEAYVNAGGGVANNPWGLYKAFLDGVHDAFGIQRSAFTSTNPCCKEYGRENENVILLTSELSYGCLNQDCLQDVLDQVDGTAGADYKGGSSYFGLVDQFGLALWITTPGAAFDCDNPSVNHFTPDGFKAVLNQLMIRAGIGWIYDPMGGNCTFYGGPILHQDYLDAIFEVRAAHGLP